MHTLKVIAGGFALLALCAIAGRLVAGGRGSAVAMKVFLALWLIATLVNLWVGVSKTGYSVRDESPIALLIFAVPAIVAGVVLWRF